MKSIVVLFVLTKILICSSNELVILFQSQAHIYFLSQIDRAASLIPETIPVVYSHSFSSTIDDWFAIYPLFPSIIERFPTMKWLLICSVETRLNLENLLDFARNSTTLFVGHGLFDVEPSIVHHYSMSFDVPFPDLSSGILISRDVLKTFVNGIRTKKRPIDFIIDIPFELSRLIEETTSVRFVDRSDLFCYQNSSNCLSSIDKTVFEQFSTGEKIDVEKVFFGIKTFVDFHQTRIPLLKRTWLKDSLKYNLFSNVDDASHRRIISNGRNTERGHCEKTFFILKFFYEQRAKFEYLVVADDDTLLSVGRVLRLIRTLILTNETPIVLGQRYAYGKHYDYPTGGSGIIFNRRAVQQIIVNCQCPSADTPDDMFLGLFFGFTSFTEFKLNLSAVRILFLLDKPISEKTD